MFTKAMIAVAVVGAITAAGAAAIHQFGCPLQYIHCCHSARESTSTETTPKEGDENSTGSNCCKQRECCTE